MESPTKKIKAPVSGAEIEIKSWISGADAEYIDEVLLSAVKITPDPLNKTANISDFDTNTVRESTHREIEKFIVSVDGKKENIVDEVCSLPEEDYEFVLGEIKARRPNNKKDISAIV